MQASATVRLGFLDIYLPDASDPAFWFMADLVPRLAVGYQHEAASLLLQAWRRRTPRSGRCTIDHEADYTFVHAHKPESIVDVAILVHDLAGAPLEPSAIDAALIELRAWRRPRRHRWKVGDVFAFSYSDGGTGYGQVLGLHLVKSPTTLLFECHHTGPDLGVADVVALPIISILHTDGTLLASGRWRVLGNAEPTLDAHAGAWRDRAISTGDASIEYLAHAWYGLIPWNVLAAEDHLDKELLPGRRRPVGAVVLSEQERQAYREQRWPARRRAGAG